MRPEIKVGMVQINNSFSNQSYFPYSAGILEAIAKRRLSEPESFEFLMPVYSRIPLKEALEKLAEADIAAFSVYVWNIGASLKIAGELKRNKPETLIVFGGPQVPDRDTENFLRCYQFIDIAAHGEGELVFPAILENYSSGDWSPIPSISYINSADEFIQNPLAERITDLNMIPSPYLEGVFDRLLDSNPGMEWVALWETNRGCPFRCTYCDWGSATKNKVYEYDLERLFKEIDWFSKNRIEFIFCCDANFAIRERDLEIVKYVAENKRRYGYPKALSVQSTKNFTERSLEAYKIMSEAELSKGVSLSLQSLNEDTLRDTRRKNISITAFKETQERLTSDNIETFTDIILGLPSETYETFADGASTVIENGQHNRIQFNNLSILPNAEMGDPEYQKRFGFRTVPTKLINIHGSLAAGAEAEEIQELVVGTKTMPPEDWIKARVFGWMTSLLYFDKLLQIPFIILNCSYSVGFRELIDIFATGRAASPILSDIQSFFTEKAVDIQKGGAEFCQSKKWLNIWWPADELVLINLSTEDKLGEFYQEAKELISRYLADKKIPDYQTVLNEALMLNQNLIKLPHQEKDLDIRLTYNIADVYHAARRGENLPLEKGEYRYTIDRTSAKWSSWEDWCREVIWYGNKKGVYLYNVR